MRRQPRRWQEGQRVTRESRRQDEQDAKSEITMPVFNRAYLRSCRKYDLKSAPSWKQVVSLARAFRIEASVASGVPNVP